MRSVPVLFKGNRSRPTDLQQRGELGGNEQLDVVAVILKRNVVVKLQANLTAAWFAVPGNNPNSLAGASQTDFNHLAPVLERVDFRSC